MPNNLTPQKIKELEAKDVFYAKEGGSKKSDMQYMHGGTNMGMNKGTYSPNSGMMNEEAGMVAAYGMSVPKGSKKMMKKGGKVMKGYMMRGGSKKNK